MTKEEFDVSIDELVSKVESFCNDILSRTIEDSWRQKGQLIDHFFAPDCHERKTIRNIQDEFEKLDDENKCAVWDHLTRGGIDELFKCGVTHRILNEQLVPAARRFHGFESAKMRILQK